MGIISGVTTKPALTAREDRCFDGVVREITALIDGLVIGKVMSADRENKQ